MNRTLVIFFLCALFLSGCVITSFNPFYKNTDLIKNEDLYGDWIGQKTLLSVQALGESSYLINYKDCEDPINAPQDYTSCTTADFTGHLIKLGDDFYLDFYPRSFLNSDNIFLAFHAKPTHSLAKVTIEKNNLEVRLVSYGWIAALLEENSKTLDHIKIDDVITLTATTTELQDFIIKHQAKPGFFENPIKLKRK